MLAVSTFALVVGAVTALATAAGVFWRIFYGKQATERKIEKLEAELRRLKDETERAFVEGRTDDFLALDKQRALCAEKRNRLLRRQ